MFVTPSRERGATSHPRKFFPLPAFADLDGEGWLDLVIGGMAGTGPRLFLNLGSGAGFAEVTASVGVFSNRDTFSATFGDYDRDGDLDLFFSHWSPLGGGNPTGAPHLWRNDGRPGEIVFNPVDWTAGIAPTYLDDDWSFTPTFTDFDSDGWPNLLVAGDFGTSQVFANRGPGEDGVVTFENRTEPMISDENGMGSAVGDYDNDGDLDWFVSSIWDPDGLPEGNWGITGNSIWDRTVCPKATGGSPATASTAIAATATAAADSPALRGPALRRSRTPPTRPGCAWVIGAGEAASPTSPRPRTAR